jgi:hypothetical protein
MRKGQITMEALLLYGAAILVVLLAIAALIYFGVLDLGIFLPEKCTLGSGASLTCDEYQITSTGKAVSIVVANKGTTSVDITGADFIAKDQGMATSCSATSFPPSIVPGNNGRVDIVCGSFNAVVGKKLSGTLVVKYKFTGGTLDNTASGDLTASVQE